MRRHRSRERVAAGPTRRRGLVRASFGGAVIAAALIAPGCATPTPRSELDTVAHIDNQAFARYASVWSKHTFDSEPVVARFALVTADPALATRLAMADATDAAAAGAARDEAAIGDAADRVAAAEAVDTVAAATAEDGAVGADTAASEHVGEVVDDAAAGAAVDGAARGTVAADRAGGGHQDAAHAGGADAAAHGAGTDVAAHAAGAEGSAHAGGTEAAAVGAQARARAAGAGANVSARRPELVLQKVAETTHALPGDRVRFTFRVHNPGPLVVERVRIVDELPPDLVAVGAEGAELESVGDGEYHLLLSGRMPVGETRRVALETRLRGDALDRRSD